MVRTISLNIQKRSTNRLGQVAATSPIYTQHVAKHDNGQVPFRTNHGTHAIRARGKNPFPSARNQFEAHPDQSHEASGAASDNTRPTDNDQGDQIRTLRRRTKSLARSNPPENDAPHGQTQPQKIWTFRNNQKTLTCGLSAVHSAAMED